MVVSRKRKRPVYHGPSPIDPVDTVKGFFPRDHEVLALTEFIQLYAPFLKVDNSALAQSEEADQIFQMILVPMDSIKDTNLDRCRDPGQVESISSIVDDVVWNLVQRRTRRKRTGKEGRNVLADGFSSSVVGQLQPAGSTSMRPGVSQNGSVSNATFCKTSKVFQRLHSFTGDELFRAILLHTSLFLPIEKDFTRPQGNFIQICGPPLSLKRESPNPSRGRKRKRRRHLRHAKGDLAQATATTIHANNAFSRFSLFYSDSYIPHVGLSGHHVLCDPIISPFELLCRIFDLKSKAGTIANRKQFRRLKLSGLEMCQAIIVKTRSFDFHRKLERYCPLPFFPRKDTSEQGLALLPDLVNAFSPSDNVASYVTSVLKNTFPQDIWGSGHNFDCVVSSVRAFVHLRRKERLPNKRLMHGICTTHIHWLQGEKRIGAKLSRRDHEATAVLTLKLLRWVFRSIIIPLLRTNFYVTESENFGQRVLYYRKPVWSAFRSLSMKKLLKGQFREMTALEVSRRLQDQAMLFSQLKLLPKATGRLCIEEAASLKGCKRRMALRSGQQDEVSTMFQRKGQRSTNAILAATFDVLTFESSRRERCFGSGLHGITDFFPRYRKFILETKQTLGPDALLNLCFVSVDIEKCYDNINQQRVLELSRDLMSCFDYIIQRYNVLYGNNITGGRERRLKKTIDSPQCETFYPVEDGAFLDQYSRVISDFRSSRMVCRGKLIELLEEHLQSNMVVTSGRFGQRYLLQTMGIPQGSILSMLLCNLYYGEMEQLILKPDHETSCSEDRTKKFMARLVDDFMFVSADQTAATEFLLHMYQGNDTFGVKVNRDKTVTSHPIQVTIRKGVSVEVSEPMSLERNSAGKLLFPWCGMLFDVETGEVFIDYERFQDGKLSDSMTVLTNGQEGTKLAERMEMFVRPRCLPILFDSSLNSEETIIVNFYQMMLFAAARTVEHLRTLRDLLLTLPNERFIVTSIRSLISFCRRQIKSNCWSFGNVEFSMEMKTLAWLSWHAFDAVFKRLRDFCPVSQAIAAELEQNRPSARKRLVPIVTEAFRLFQLHRMIQLKCAK
eukprot:Nitzschia sp. Nitz4//scaffold166_size90379//33142//36399//NITZ4_005054-RA/size90379-processed-gene-0.126-mRNA-1//-1//CDS//3329538187//5931//frame0